jgi:hypothetical protein
MWGSLHSIWDLFLTIAKLSVGYFKNLKLTLTNLITWEFSQVASLWRLGAQTRIEMRLFSLFQLMGYSLFFLGRFGKWQKDGKINEINEGMKNKL